MPSIHLHHRGHDNMNKINKLRWLGKPPLPPDEMRPQFLLKQEASVEGKTQFDSLCESHARSNGHKYSEHSETNEHNLARDSTNPIFGLVMVLIQTDFTQQVFTIRDQSTGKN